MNDSPIARRYAKSLYLLGVENKALQTFADDMDMVKNVYNQQPQLQWILNNPVMNLSKKLEIVRKIFGRHLHQHTMSFIVLIIRKGRAIYFPDIYRSFTSMFMEHEGLKEAKLTLAVDVDQKIKQKIQKVLEQQTGNTIRLTSQMESSIIGGFILRVGDQQLDASVQGHLSEIRKQIQN